MDNAGVVDFLDFVPPTCDHVTDFQGDCVACAIRVVSLFLPVSMRLYVESRSGRYFAGAADRDGFFRVVAEGLTPADALANLRNPLARIAFSDSSEVDA